jgi:magnesium-transporting ATPase (P-type)
MFVLFIIATVLTFIMIFLSPLATSSRPPQTIAPDPNMNAARPPHRRRTFIFLRALPFFILSFLTALFTVVATVVATVMFIIFKNVFTSEDYSLNIEAELGTRMMVFMWIASACNLISFILQLGSCCAACCGGRKARKMLKNGGMATNGSLRREKDAPHSPATTATD